MKSETGESVSLWMATADVPTEKPLAESIDADTCIVGAGIAGLSVAYFLAKAGKKVVVLDDGPIASGQTQRTTAHLSNALDDRYYEIIRVRGEDAARLAADSHTAAIDAIEKAVADESIACDFARLDGYLFLGGDSTEHELDKELDAAHKAGLTRVEKLARPAINGFDPGVALRFPGQGQFHVLKYLSGLVRAIEKLGGAVYTGTHVEKIEPGPPAKVHAKDGPVVSAASVVVATNTPINDLVAIHTKQAPYITYAIAARVPRGSITPALYWDTADPYHYIRLRADGGRRRRAHRRRRGPQDRPGATTGDERYNRLEAWARERFPTMGPVEYRWSGQVMESIDGLGLHRPQPGRRRATSTSPPATRAWA